MNLSGLIFGTPLQKITANNTWGFALIDYFADLTLLRNGPNDASESLAPVSNLLAHTTLVKASISRKLPVLLTGVSKSGHLGLIPWPQRLESC